MSIRVATLNTWALPGPLSKQRDARIDAICRDLPGIEVDVFAFQEVWTQSARDDLSAALAANGYEHRWHHRRTLGGSGLLLASRLPMREVRFERFASQGFAERIQHMDYYAGKGFVRATIETESGPVVVLATHLHANYAAPGDPDEYLGVRAAQLIQLVSGLADVRAPVIALGDFNVQEYETGYQLLRGLAGLRDVAATLDRREATSRADNPYHRANHVDARIDYVFDRPGVDLAPVPRSIQRIFDAPLDFDGTPGTYSDHSGLLAVFDLVSGKRSQPFEPQQEALRLGSELISSGRAISARRRSRKRLAATAGALVAVTAAAGARRAGRTRRRFLRNSLGLLSGLSLGWMLEQTWQSEWMHEGEVSGFDVANRQLIRLLIGRRSAE